MPDLDTAWAERKVAEFVELLHESKRQWDRDFESHLGHGPQWDQLETEINSRFQTIIDIAASVNEGLIDGLIVLDGGYSWRRATQRRSAVILLGAIRDLEERQAHIHPGRPELGDLHPWVLEEAQDRWVSGQYRDAVQAAATRIFDQELPKKLGVSPVENPANLMAAFATDPNKKPEPIVRLRFSDVPQTDPSWQSIHRGVMLFGQGCVGAIRNPRTHRLDAPEDEIALEELGALSLLARWISEATPVIEPPYLAEQ
jgi:hypothetical protein